VLCVSEYAGASLGARELELVDDLAAHAGRLVHNARLAAELAGRVRVLQAQTAALREALRSLVSAQDGERRRLERNLHDGAQHELLALLLSLQALRPALTGAEVGETHRALAELSELRGRLRSTGWAVEELCGGGLPAELADGGPVAALAPVAESLRRAGFTVEVTEQSSSPESPGRTAPDIEAAVFFACVEALQNAAKHARARSMRVELRWDAEELEFSVSDDGVGFDPAGAEASGSLATLVERVAVVGGTLGIQSAPGLGTTVRGRVALPLPAVVRAVIAGGATP
jgi:signal transduction histidine kinase